MLDISYTKHARYKFRILKKFGVLITRTQIKKCLMYPTKSENAKQADLLINTIGIDKKHVLRVVYRRINDHYLVITFYPGRRNQYEN